MKFLISAIFFLQLSEIIVAQQFVSISGHVTNSKGEKLVSATVFIDGSSIQTKTDEEGNYEISNLTPGTYQIAISSVGYESLKKSILVRQKKNTLNFIVTEKITTLEEVAIGDSSSRRANLKIFIERFLGISNNALSCKILNTEIINFTTYQDILAADTEDFLIIENKNLGYRIKYLLKKFIFNKKMRITQYDGECIFEEMAGTKMEESKWASNREKTYKGSFMHFLRSLNQGSLQTEGFIIHEFIDPKKDPLKKDTVHISHYIQRLDGNFIRLSFKQLLHVTYKTKEAKNLNNLPINKPLTGIEFRLLGYKTSMVNMYLAYTIVDKAGRYLDPRSFLLDGTWGSRQMGDRLPYSYQP